MASLIAVVAGAVSFDSNDLLQPAQAATLWGSVAAGVGVVLSGSWAFYKRDPLDGRAGWLR